MSLCVATKTQAAAVAKTPNGTHRCVDRRLQTLRRAGKIRYSGKVWGLT
jgi:hypothetical protein